MADQEKRGQGKVALVTQRAEGMEPAGAWQCRPLAWGQRWAEATSAGAGDVCAGRGAAGAGKAPPGARGPGLTHGAVPEQQAGCQAAQIPTKRPLCVPLPRPALAGDRNAQLGSFFQCSWAASLALKPSPGIARAGFEMGAEGPSDDVPVPGRGLCMGDEAQAAAQRQGKEVSRGGRKRAPSPEEPPCASGHKLIICGGWEGICHHLPLVSAVGSNKQVRRGGFGGVISWRTALFPLSAPYK